MKHERDIGHLHYQLVFDLCVRHKQWQAMVVKYPDISKPTESEIVWCSLSEDSLSAANVAYQNWINSSACPDDYLIFITGMYGGGDALD
jgi:hypothetical protein